MNTDGFTKSRAVLQEADPSGVIVTIIRVNTPGSPLLPVEGTGKVRESSHVDLAKEIVNLHTTKYGFLANLKTLQTEDKVLGSMFDILA